jgi:release factor glutamine methyltransferase
MTSNQLPISNIGETLAEACRRLEDVSSSAGLDAQVLLASVLGQTRSWLLAHGDVFLTKEQDRQFESMLARLEAGEPLPYLLGEWEFYGLKFYVTPGVLIPRPETELLVQQALDWLGGHLGRSQALDVGCGSGVIAVSIAKNNAEISFTAIDNSEAALEICDRNVRRHGLAQRIKLMRSDLLEGLQGRYDLICANLPYIPSSRLLELTVANHEPVHALNGGPDGLTLIRRFLRKVPAFINPGGLILLEIDATHGQPVASMAEAFFPESVIRIEKDLAGLQRLLVVEVAL